MLAVCLRKVMCIFKLFLEMEYALFLEMEYALFEERVFFNE